MVKEDFPIAGAALGYQSITKAAKVINVSPGTLRRWCREDGCPAKLVGHDRYRVNVADVLAWRAAKTPNQEAQLREIAGLALDFWRRGREPGVEGQRLLGVSDAKAAALLCFFFDYLVTRIYKPGRLHLLETDPQAVELHTSEIELLEKIALQGIVHGLDDSLH